MCGIVGYVGGNKCLPILVEGLKKLEYRGYDSAGVAYQEGADIKIIKSVGRISNLEKKLNFATKGFSGIGHTRWATHGEVNEINSHPHHVGQITIVHNGILENYQLLKKKLENDGYDFFTTTDTEVLCAYIDYEYSRSENKNMIEILEKCLNVFEGSFAVCIMVDGISNKIFVMKKDSPLVIGYGNKENFIASDISAFAKKTNKYIILEDGEIGIVDDENVEIFYNNNKVEKTIKSTTVEESDDINGYEHFMLKEISEQGEIIEKLNGIYLEHMEKIPSIDKFRKIHIIGCGTAYYAGMIGKYLIEHFSGFEVQTYIASEYRYQNIFVDEETLVIVTSQSGETADTLACLKKVKALGCKTLGIVNVKNSSIARIVDNVIYTEAGSEIAVASTKAYTSQIYILSLIALKLGIAKRKIEFNEIQDSYSKLKDNISNLLNNNYNEIIRPLVKAKDVFYLGRNIDYVTMLEGALKIKEISYIHSEAYPAGELKHGTISLIEKGTPVIALISNDDICLKTISNIKEVKSRGAYVILLIKNSLNVDLDDDCYDDIIYIDDSHYLTQAILNVIPLQLIAYYTAKERGCDIDKPRNLAKSVTVE